MTFTPAIPALVIVPEATHIDYKALYSIATAYAHSGLLLSNHGSKTHRMEFTFPAIVCSSFAIELFMKFFLMLDRSETKDAPVEHDSGHKLSGLWSKINLDHQRLIAGMFRNSTGTPVLNAADRRIEWFLESLSGIGDIPFVRWRYAYELPDITLVSHEAVAEVLDALGRAAEYSMKQKANVN